MIVLFIVISIKWVNKCNIVTSKNNVNVKTTAFKIILRKVHNS